MQLDQLEASIDEGLGGDYQSLLRFALEAHAFAQALREHIAKEDEHLFRMADLFLTEEDQALLLRQFAHAEAHEMGTLAHEQYLDLAAGLAKRFGRKPVAEDPGHAACAGCCHHAHP
jgi:hemerythrin-like domain-containing protein